MSKQQIRIILVCLRMSYAEFAFMLAIRTMEFQKNKIIQYFIRSVLMCFILIQSYLAFISTITALYRKSPKFKALRTQDSV